jgi:hypothetical protein
LAFLKATAKCNTKAHLAASSAERPPAWQGQR